MPNFEIGLTFKELKEIHTAVLSKRAKSYWVAHINTLYSIIQLGVGVNMNDLTHEEVIGLLALGREIEADAERRRKIDSMRNK